MTAPPMYQPSWQTPQSQRPAVQQTPQTPRPYTGRRTSPKQASQVAEGALQQPQPQTPQRPQSQTPSVSEPGQQPPQARPTFAQMQQQGQARPAPPGGAVQGQLEGAISDQLANPGRYGLPQVQQVNDALTNQTNQEFGAKQKQLDEEMARRGVGSSSIAGGYMGDLAGQQGNALASMRATLIQNAAQTNAQDRAAATGAGQAYLTGEQNYGLSQGDLNLRSRTADQQFGLQQGELTGNYNGQETLASRGQGIQGQQFKDQLAQALGIATMGDKTANRAVDANAALAQNDMMMKVMALLQQYGVSPTGATSPTTPTTPTNPTSPTNPTNPNNPPVDDPTVRTPIETYGRPGAPSRASFTQAPAGGSTLGASTGTVQRPAQPQGAGYSAQTAPGVSGSTSNVLQQLFAGGQQNPSPNPGFTPPGGFGTNTAGPQANGYPAASPGFWNPYDKMLADSKAALANGPQANGSDGPHYRNADGSDMSAEEAQRQTLAGRTADATNTVNSWKNAGALFSDTMPAGQSMTGPDGKPVLPGGSMQDMIKQLLARYQGG